MSEAAEEVELIELPVELDGLPYSTKALAFDSALGMLPAPAILAQLGQAQAEVIWANAAAHWLVKTGKTTVGAHPKLRGGADLGVWAGSDYGDVVFAALAKLPRSTGRSRRAPIVV